MQHIECALRRQFIKYLDEKKKVQAFSSNEDTCVQGEIMDFRTVCLEIDEFSNLHKTKQNKTKFGRLWAKLTVFANAALP